MMKDEKKVIEKDRWFNPFWSIWLKHLMSRPSCYKCPFATTERVADISLGDLWGVHLYCPELYGKNGGASLAVANTDKGRTVLQAAEAEMYGHELKFEESLKYQSPMRKHIDSNPDREQFMQDLKGSMTYEEINQKWADKPSVRLLWQKYIWGNRQKVWLWNLTHRNQKWEDPSKMFRADAKAQVSYDYDTGRITTFLCSVQHSPDVEVSDFRHIIESMMVLAACEYGLDGDFTKLVNPTGRFVLGGSCADCGVTGRKLACDTYGGIGRMGGGALSGKDPTKVDRSAAYMARKIAKDIVQAGYVDKCEVQLAYAIGVVQPVGVAVECFGTEHQSLDFIEAYVHDSYDLTPQGIIKRLGLLDVDYNKVSAYGHFGKAGLPWED